MPGIRQYDQHSAGDDGMRPFGERRGHGIGVALHDKRRRTDLAALQRSRPR